MDTSTHLSAAASLSAEERARYARHIDLRQVGEKGQLTLKGSKILVIGMGGLGSPAALYLAAAGIGVLGLVDFDKVERSNLQRQILYQESDIGKGKAECAAAFLRQNNPSTQLEVYEQRLDKKLAHQLFPHFDLIIDGTDNFHARYLINDMCLVHGKPNLSASIHQFEGRLSLFCTQTAPCYRCLFPEPPPPGQIGSCAEGGVLGVLPGVVGALLASEAIKFLLKLGQSLAGRYLIYDALSLNLKEIKLQANPNCATCKQLLSYDKVTEYTHSCLQASVSTTDQMDAAELARLLRESKSLHLIDVRSEAEVCKSQIEGAQWIPLAQLAHRLPSLSKEEDYVVYCQKGIRSQQALQILKKNGLTKVKSLQGGIEKWHAYMKTTATEK